MSDKNTIHITWDGPYCLEEAKQKNDVEVDYGVYQIYGSHPLYGAGILLYIGRTERQTFGQRISQESWEWKHVDPGNIQIYFGRLGGYTNVSNDDWKWQIVTAESLLILAHTPVANSSGLNKTFDTKQYADVHVLNWGSRRSLFPEITGRFFTTHFSEYGYKIFRYTS